MRGGIYLDNASTSFPKPGIIGETIELYLRDAGCSPGRSGHARARISEKLINDARQKIADILGVGDHSKIAYTHN
ncbi:aminotransferase class V-fold PLP-dependent enzyme, partial [TM7 phylum sp. oral taxon 352]